MKRAVFLILTALVIFTGCSAEPVCTSEFAPQSGSYEAKATKSSIIAPKLGIDLEDNKFSFYFDALSSYIAVGSIETENNGYFLRCITDDEKYVYNFRITAADTIIFVAEDSSPIDMIQGEPSVVDGTEFKLVK